MENTSDEEIEFFRILLRFSLTQNNYSCQIPKTWTVKILKNFILHSFKNELKNNFNLIFSGKILQNDDQLISTILKKEENFNQIFVSIKQDNSKQESKFEKNLKDPKKFDVTQTAAFQLAEKGLILNAIEKLAKSNLNGENTSINMNFINQNMEIISRMPLFSTQLRDRIAFETRKKRLNIFSYEDTIIENYPLRDYFKFEILFKLVMFFILFGFQIKGYNLPIFISLLILYYWYNVYTDVKGYYTKKEEAIKQYIKELDPKLVEQESEEGSEYESEDEKSEVNLSPNQKLNENENIHLNNESNKILNQENNNNEINNNLEEKNKIETLTKIIDNNHNNNIEKINEFFDNKLNEETDIIIENNVKEDAKIKNENLLEESDNFNKMENTRFVNRKISENINSDNIPDRKISNEMKDIAPMLEKFEKKKKKKENIPEGPIKYFVTFIFEVIFTFILSLIPAWSDEFENNNPIIHNQENQNNNPNNLEQNNNNQNNENINTNINNQNNLNNIIEEEKKDDFNDTNIRNFNQGNINNYNEYENIQFQEQEQQFNENENENEIMQFKRITLKEAEISKENERQNLDSNNSMSERLYNKSANDKILNSEMEPVRRKIVINEDTGNKNENEFVFPENLNLDNLSYNEAFLESNKKKPNDDDLNKLN